MAGATPSAWSVPKVTRSARTSEGSFRPVTVAVLLAHSPNPANSRFSSR